MLSKARMHDYLSLIFFVPHKMRKIFLEWLEKNRNDMRDWRFGKMRRTFISIDQQIGFMPLTRDLQVFAYKLPVPVPTNCLGNAMHSPTDLLNRDVDRRMEAMKASLPPLWPNHCSGNAMHSPIDLLNHYVDRRMEAMKASLPPVS